jgi:gliding motility-associated-like protein
MKYDFIVSPGGNYKNIEIEYNGADDLYIENGVLYVKTTITDIIENKPFAYQIIDGEKVEVQCNFKLRKNILKFSLPNGYDKTKDLIIDPVLIFSSYSGSTADNFGFTATYDTLGQTYGAGIVFGTGYPTSTGAYDNTYNGVISAVPTVDIGISKFNATGTALLYSTYIGGSGGEAPHSLVTNDAGELYVFGTTGSSNYPRTTGCYDNTFAGGTTINPNGSGVRYSSGCDIFVTKFNATGTGLIGSTFIGGTGNDGINIATGMAFNYGDEFRGEIIVDDLNNCYVATATNSTNFPVVGGMGSQGGTSDAVVFKFNPTLTTLLWSTHFGGSSDDAAYAIQQDAIGNTFIAGGTKSTNLDSAQNTNSGGVDGFLTKYSPTNNLLSSKYIGTTLYDQCFFVQLDISDSVYTYGQSLGTMPITAGKYSNPGSHQFIQKYDNTLTTLSFSTIFGSSSSTINISPSAFLVNDCGLIYMSGWGGTVNGIGSTTGMPVTTGSSAAYQATTDGSDFYLMVLEKNADALNYATFFGGTAAAEHVDGGTSRFDKKGNVYQAVCAGCGGNSNFPSTTGTYSSTNGSSNCNLAVFKFNINEIQAIASIPTVVICYPNAAFFSNSSTNGNAYLWNFGDGNTSTAFAPTHFYGAAGTYTATLLVYDSTGCIKPDSSTITINVFDPAAAVTSPDTVICPNTSVQLLATGGTSYLWSPSATLSNDTIANPIATPTGPTTYRVIVSNICGIDTNYINVTFHTITTNTSNDTTICSGDTAQLFASGGGTYNWTPSTSVVNSTLSTPSIFPSATTNYYVNIVTPEGCNAIDSVLITVINIPNPVLSDDDSICFGDQIILNASGADSYSWTPFHTLSGNTGTTVTAKPANTTTYYVSFTNQCATLIDSVTITVVVPQAFSSPDDTICFNESTTIWATGGVSYSWSPSSYTTSPTNDTTDVNPPTPTIFRVVVTDAVGCTDTAFTSISFSPIPTIDAGKDQIINYGQTAFLNAISSAGSFSWTPDLTLASTINKSTSAQPSNTNTYFANLIDPYGCSVKDSVTISLDGSLYIPNTFSPNGDELNDIFKIHAEDITQFEIIIFNRWGEILYESKDINKGWNGFHKGKVCQIDAYVWRIVYSDVNTSKKEVFGHVNLVK